MNRRILSSLCVALLLVTVPPASAADFYVNGSNASGTEVGTQQSPFRTVQAAIDAASGSDKIRVAAGTYVENLRVDGKPLVLEGGYSSAWIRDLSKNTTTLSGAAGNAVINLIAADATIDGFRITGGTGSTEELPYAYHGGGIYSRDGSPTISNNVIEANDIRSANPPSDYNLGGGLYVANATTATIVNNVVRGNYSGRGAGMAVFGQSALIRGNTVENNIAVGDHGGGMYIAVVNATITQNVIRGNEVGRALGYGWGGGVIVFNTGNSAELSFNVLVGNFAAAYGAAEFIDEGATASIHHELIYSNLSKDGCEAVSAIAVDGGNGVGSQATISHCTVVNNVCENATRGNGLQVEDQSVVSVTNSIFWNNGGDDFATDGTATLTVTFTDTQEGFAGTGNISADPSFINAAADDYRVAVGSACIDAADPASPFDKEPIPNGGRADMGRYGNASETASSGGPIDGGNAPGGSVPGSVDGSTNNGSTSDANSAEGNSGDDGNPATEGADEVVADSVLSTGACPSAAAMMLSISLIGVRRTRNVAADRRVGRRER
jgi:hypothetical protein